MLQRSKQIQVFSAFILLFGFSTKSSAQIVTAWISNCLFPGAISSTATVVKADQSGNIFLGGTAGNNFVVKYNTTGEVIWLQTYDSGDTLSEVPNTLCIDNQGNAYITFMKHTLGGTYWSLAVQKYSASDGVLQWTSEIANAQFNAFEWQVKPNYMAIDNNHLYVAGTKFEPGITGSEMLIAKMDFNGDTIWTRTHKGSGIYSNSKSVTVDPSGNVYIAGDAWNASIDYCVVKFDPDGNLLWDAFYDGQIYNSTDIAEKVIVDNVGNVYITGYNQISSNQKDIVTVKYDQNGNFLWDQSYGNPDYSSNNAYYLENDASGNLYVGGYSAYENPYPGTGKDYILLKYDPGGNLLWDARYDHFNYINDHPFDFDMGPEGDIYICGISIKSCYPSEFITVVKCNPQGEFVWNFCVPGLYGTPWEIDVINDDEFVVAAGAIDSMMVNDATVIKYTSAPASGYGADITNIFFESQIAPPVIDYENHTVIATVHDSVNLEFLVPYIAISDYACMYPDDGDTTSFVVPVWYNVASFDNVEQWWIVYVEGGFVGLDEHETGDFQIFPNPTANKFKVRSLEYGVIGATIEIFDLNGRKLIEKFIRTGNKTTAIDVNSLQDGMYLVQFQSENQKITQKLIIQK